MGVVSTPFLVGAFPAFFFVTVVDYLSDVLFNVCSKCARIYVDRNTCPTAHMDTIDYSRQNRQRQTDQRPKRPRVNRKDLESIFEDVILNPPLNVKPEHIDIVQQWKTATKLYLDPNGTASTFMQYDGPLRKTRSIMAVPFNELGSSADRKILIDYVKQGIESLHIEDNAMSATLRVLNSLKKVVDRKKLSKGQKQPRLPDE